MLGFRRISLAFAAFTLAFGLTTAGARAQEITADQVREALGFEIPPPWQIKSVTLQPTNPGERRSAPDVSHDFTVAIELASPTFLLDRQEGPFTLVRPVAPAGLGKTLIGVVRIVNRGATKVARLEIQNREVMDNIGKPLDRFPGQPLIKGEDRTAKLLAELEQEQAQRQQAEKVRREKEESQLTELVGALKVEGDRVVAERKLMAQRAEALAELRRDFTSNDRAQRLAAIEAGIRHADPIIRALAFEAAYSARDPAMANLAIGLFLARKKTIPVQLFATKEDRNSPVVLHNLGPLTLTLANFDPAAGVLTGTLGAQGYSVTQPASAFGTLSQTELSINTFGCTLTLRLSEVQTLDGLYRCQTLPTLIARITLD